jgi:hypothetical protein
MSADVFDLVARKRKCVGAVVPPLFQANLVVQHHDGANEEPVVDKGEAATARADSELASATQPQGTRCEVDGLLAPENDVFSLIF